MVKQHPSLPARWLAAVAMCTAAAFTAPRLPAQAVSAPLTITTLAGLAGEHETTNGTGSAARFYSPAGLIVDRSGNLIIADSSNNIIRKVTPAGVVTTFSGTPVDPNSRPINIGTSDGPADAASFHMGEDGIIGANTLGIDANGNISFADTLSNTIRTVSTTGAVTTVSGAANASGSTNGAARDARYLVPTGVAVDNSGNIFVADGGNQLIRKITPAGVVTTFAGAARQVGSDDGAASSARFRNPSGVAVDSSGNIYVSDTGNHTIRKITAAGFVSTLAGMAETRGTADGSGTQARFDGPTGIAVDASGNVYVADTGNNAIRKISPAGTVGTVAGTKGVAGTANGTGTAAQFNQPYGITVDAAGTVYISDTGNHTIRRGVAATDAGSLQVTAVPPAKVQVNTGATVTLKIVATGTPSPTFQWTKDGVPLSGANTATLTLVSVATANAGFYSVTATSGSVTYSTAPTQVQVFAPPTPVPSIALISQPTDRSVTAGQSTTFTVEATSSTIMTYQWTKDGTPILGATSSSYTVSSAQTANAGVYAVTVTDASSSVTTAGATLSIAGQTTTVAPTIATQPTAQTVSVGGTATFTVVASGTPSPTYQWQKSGSAVLNTANVSGATTATLTISNATPSDAGSYTVVASNSAGVATSSAATLTVNTVQPPPPTGPNAWLVNLSVRTTMQAGQGPLIVGFSVTGGAKDILVRGVGPTLADYGVTGTMVDPQLEVHPNNVATPSLVSDDWSTSISNIIASVAFPLRAGSKDAAFVQSMQGLYSIWERPTGAGTVLVEAYDTNPGSNSPRLANLSARNRVGTGGDILIEGFSIRGTGKKRLLVRAVGPTLASLGVTGVLADPKIEVYNAANAKIAENDTWDASLVSVFPTVGAFGLNAGSKDAAMIVELDASANYTVQCKGSDGGTGEALVEVYELP